MGTVTSLIGTFMVMTALTAFTVVGAASVALLVWADAHGSWLRRVAKPAASACFVAAGLSAGAADSSYGKWVLTALILSAIGDVALLGKSSSAFLAGLGSFLLGHVGYTIAFGVRGLDALWTLAAVVALLAPVAVVIRWLWPHVPAEMKGPVGAYMVVISAMVAASVGTVGWDADLRIVIAAVAFYLSDLAVARDRFVAPGPQNRLWGLPLYYGAQFLFAWTVVV